MLLYVDKKKERQKKIRRTLLIISIIFVICVNFICFSTDLNQTKNSLLEYSAQTSAPQWYTQTEVITILSSPSKTELVILIPQHFNRENLKTIAYAFSHIPPQATEINFTSEIKESSLLLKLAQIFAPEIKSNSHSTQIIISSDEDKILELTQSKNYYPQTINYTTSSNTFQNQELQTFLDKYAPLPPISTTTQEQEKENLNQLIKDHKDIILSVIPSKPYSTISYPISSQYILLQNASICLSSQEKKICKINSDHSLTQNVTEAIQKFPPHEKIQKLSLLTSLQEIPIHSPLTQDDGLLFRFDQREHILLPQEIEQHLKKQTSTDIYRYIKQQAGLNPDYSTPKMKFYKFKTVEINIDDNI